MATVGKGPVGLGPKNLDLNFVKTQVLLAGSEAL